MAKFIFKMQNVLDIKEKLEKQKKNELAEAIATVNKYKMQKSNVERETKGIINDMKTGLGKKISAEDIKQGNNYLALLKKVLEQVIKNINISERQVDKKREELVKVMTERKMYEKLREKELEEFKKEENTKEQKLLDEVASYKHMKSNEAKNDDIE